MNKTQLKILALSTNTNLDWSYYVLISSCILNDLLQIKNQLKEIQALYLNNQSNEAISLILSICEQYKQEHKHQNTFELIISKAATINNNPMLLETRRYFELKYFESIWNEIDSNDFNSVQKLVDSMHEKNANIVHRFSVQSLQDVGTAIHLMRQYSEQTPESYQLEVAISLLSRSYQKKDRGKNITESNLSSPNESNAIYSTNLGIMRSMMPSSLIDKGALKINRLPDVFVIDPNIEQGFSSSRPDIPFVNSTSGTFFAFLAVLTVLLKEHQNEPKATLQSDVNALLKSHITYTCLQGYHSFSEIIEILKEEPIINWFKPYDVSFDWDFSKQALEKSYLKAVDYAITTSLKKNEQRSLRAYFDAKKSIVTEQSFEHAKTHSNQSTSLANVV